MKTLKLSLLACAMALLSLTVSPDARAHDGGSSMKNCLPMSKTGDADVDFIRSMIPHHQMALKMAETELKNGKDAAAKEMAQDIITAQKREISTMETWLKTHR